MGRLPRKQVTAVDSKFADSLEDIRMMVHDFPAPAQPIVAQILVNTLVAEFQNKVQTGQINGLFCDSKSDG